MTATTSPLVAAYLADLDRALAGADPADRLEIVDAVREHIDAAVAELGASPTQAQIATVLRRLGTADDVAAAWAVGADRPAPPSTAHGLTPVPPVEGRRETSPWLKALVVIVGLALGVPLVLGIATSAFLVATGSDTWGYHHVAPGWVAVTVVVALVTAALGTLGFRRGAKKHRRTWRTAFVVGLVLVAGLLLWGLHMGGYVGGRYDGTLPYSVPSPGVVVPAPPAGP